MAMNNPYAAYQKMANKYGAPKKKPQAPRIIEGQEPAAVAAVPPEKGEALEKKVAGYPGIVPAAARVPATGTVPAAGASARGEGQAGGEQRTVPFPPLQDAGRAERRQAPQKPVNPYVEKAIMTASPQDLTLMLYDGAIRFMRQSAAAIQEKDIEKAHNASVRAQDIFIELMSTLNKDYEIANYLFSLYVFILDNLAKANLKKDPVMIEEMIELTREMRDTWREAVDSMKGERLAGAGVSG